MIFEALVSVEMTMRSMGAVLAVAVVLWFWFGRRLRSTAKEALAVLRDAVETLTTGWWSQPLPAELPGPRGLPLLGYLLFLGRRPHEKLAAVAERYAGGAFRLSAGSRRFVVVSRIEMLRQLAGRYANQLRGKPRTFITQQMTLGAHNDMIQRWKRRRAYTDAGLRLIEKTTNSDILHEEVDALMSFFSMQSGPADVRHDITLTGARVMYRMAYGRCPDETALEGLRHIVHTLPDYTTTIGSLSWFDAFPLWRLLRRSTLHKFIQFNQYAAAFCRREKHRSLDEMGEADRGLGDARGQLGDSGRNQAVPSSLFEFFRQKLSRLSTAERDRFCLTEDVLFDGLEDIIRAGSESSSLVAQWFLLYVAAFPRVQQRMRQELENHAGAAAGSAEDFTLTADEVRALPYCSAAFAETCRFCCLNPFLKRELTDDIELDGVRLPRGTVLLYNSWAINNDRRHWTDPERFLPERFLTPDGHFDEAKMSLMVPFGFGKRRCIGVETGRALCMLVAASVVQRFDVTLDADKPDFDPVVGIGLAPRPYRVHFSPRS